MGFGKAGHFFCLNSLFLMFGGIVNGFMTNYIPPWRLWSSRNWSIKTDERYHEFLLL